MSPHHRSCRNCGRKLVDTPYARCSTCRLARAKVPVETRPCKDCKDPIRIRGGFIRCEHCRFSRRRPNLSSPTISSPTKSSARQTLSFDPLVNSFAANTAIRRASDTNMMHKLHPEMHDTRIFAPTGRSSETSSPQFCLTAGLLQREDQRDRKDLVYSGYSSPIPFTDPRQRLPGGYQSSYGQLPNDYSSQESLSERNTTWPESNIAPDSTPVKSWLEVVLTK
jgi:hypothetical protein